MNEANAHPYDSYDTCEQPWFPASDFAKRGWAMFFFGTTSIA